MKIKNYLLLLIFSIPSLMAQNEFKKELNIQPNTLEDRVFDAAEISRYKKIGDRKSINEARRRDLEAVIKPIANLKDKQLQRSRLKALLVMQLDMAIFIAERIRFDLSKDLNAFADYFDEVLIDGKELRFTEGRAFWIYLLAWAKIQLNNDEAIHEMAKNQNLSVEIVENQNILIASNMINNFLEDIGFMYEAKGNWTLIDYLINNFMLLFDHFDVVKKVKIVRKDWKEIPIKSAKTGQYIVRKLYLNPTLKELEQFDLKKLSKDKVVKLYASSTSEQ